MDHNYTSTGQIRLAGYSLYTFYKLFYVKFKVGSIVYSRPKALRGIYEKIVIKKIRIFPEREYPLKKVCHLCNFPPMYIDTLNAYHNEEDLVGPDDVVSLIENFILQQREALERC